MAAELFTREREREQLQALADAAPTVMIADAARELGIDLTRLLPLPGTRRLATQREARRYLSVSAAEWSVLSRADREAIVNDYADSFGLRRMRLSWGNCGWEEIPGDQDAVMPPWQLGVPGT